MFGLFVCLFVSLLRRIVLCVGLRLLCLFGFCRLVGLFVVFCVVCVCCVFGLDCVGVVCVVFGLVVVAFVLFRFVFRFGICCCVWVAFVGFDLLFLVSVCGWSGCVVCCVCSIVRLLSRLVVFMF